MKKMLGYTLAAIVLVTATPVLAIDNAKSSMGMKPKCAAGDPVVMLDTSSKMYHATTDKKSHAMTVKSGHKMTLVCKSKADAMGAMMMKM